MRHEDKRESGVTTVAAVGTNIARAHWLASMSYCIRRVPVSGLSITSKEALRYSSGSSLGSGGNGAGSSAPFFFPPFFFPPAFFLPIAAQRRFCLWLLPVAFASRKTLL